VVGVDILHAGIAQAARVSVGGGGAAVVDIFCVVRGAQHSADGHALGAIIAPALSEIVRGRWAELAQRMRRVSEAGSGWLVVAGLAVVAIIRFTGRLRCRRNTGRWARWIT